MKARSESEAWNEWNLRVQDILGTREPQINRGSLPYPWFLVPQGEELSKEAAEDLFYTIRRRFLLTDTFNTSAEAVRGRIRKLQAKACLPLLYAMRHVAKDHGTAGRYWPAFREDVLENRIALAEVQQKLGPALGEVWKRFHLRTHNKLYVPREGRENIKWPLAHAGLLRGDEDALNAFGLTLAARYGSEKAAPLTLEYLSEFLRAFSNWLTEQQGESRLARLIGSSDSTERIIGELAQRRIRENWSQLSERRVYPVGTSMQYHKSFLRYNTDGNRILLVVSEGIWPGDVAVQAKWGSKQISVPSRFSNEKRHTEHSALNLPLIKPTWSENLLLLAEKESRPVRVPAPPEDRSLVFRSSDGRAINRWTLDEEYLVVVSANRLHERWLDCIFKEWSFLSPPEGWEGYQTIFCRVRDPLSVSFPNDNVSSGLATGIHEFEQAAQGLGLPSFNSLWRPSARLIGGSRLSAPKNEPVFSAEEPPHLEVRGVWERQLPVSLAKWEKDGNRFVVLDQTSIPPPQAHDSYILELWPEKVSAEGNYRVEIGSLPKVDFRIAHLKPSPSLRKLDLKLEVFPQDANTPSKSPSTSDLERGALAVRAWPHARLTLDTLYGGQRRSILIFTDEAGEWRARWRDMGLSTKDAGRIILTLSWRGLARHRIDIANVPFISEDEFALETQGHGSELRWVARGRVSNRRTARRVRIVLLGARPWAGEVWGRMVKLDETDSFEATFSPGEKDVCWVVVLPGDPASSSLHRPWLIQTLSKACVFDKLSLDELCCPWAEEWEKMVPALKQTALPPALNTLVDLQVLKEFISVHPRWPSSRPQWISLDEPEALTQFSGWTARGMTSDLAILADTPPGLVGSNAEPSLPSLAVEGSELAAATARGEGSASLKNVASSGSYNKLESHLEVGTDGETALVLSVGETLYACPKCHAILPPGEFERHRPLALGLSPCTVGKRSYKVFRVGRRVPVHLFSRWDRRQIVSQISDLILSIAAGNEPEVPPHAECWLEELEAAFDESPHNELTDWLIALPVLTQKIRRMLGREHSTLSELAELGQQIRRHRAGLHVLWRWLNKEMSN